MPIRRLRRDESGSTLVELLVTLVILGIAFVTLLGGMFTAVTTSDRHRKQTVADSILRSVAESVKAAEYLDDCGYTPASGRAGFTATRVRCCPLPPPSTTTSSPVPAAALTTVVSTVPLPTTVTTPCVPPSGGAPQLVTLQVASDDGRATETVDVVKRDERP